MIFTQFVFKFVGKFNLLTFFMKKLISTAEIFNKVKLDRENE